MAAAASVDSFGPTAAVRTKHVTRDRPRPAVGGSFGLRRTDEEKARDARRCEEGRLDERERTELLLAWSGNESSLGCRSSHASVVDKLLRAPPRDGVVIERAIEEELLRHGRQGRERERLAMLLVDEGVATKHEVRRTLRAMAGKGAVEYFTAAVEREQRRQRQRPAGGPGTMLSGAEQAETVSGAPVKQEKHKPLLEKVDVEMVRLVHRADRRVPEAVPPEERWRRADAALEAYCQVISCSESTPSGGARLPPSQGRGRADEALRALRRAPSDARRVLERAYGTVATPRWGAEVWGTDEVSRLAALTPSVELARRALVAERSTPGSRATVDRSTFAADAMRAKLDAQPEGEIERIRWRAERERFVEAVRKEAAKMLADAVRSYRDAREG